MTPTQRATRLARELPRLYPDARCELVHRNPLELLVATILSAQCTDLRVNQVTEVLFRRCGDAAAYASIPLEELQDIIRPTGFFRNKARSLRGMGAALLERHGGEVPSTMEELRALPGTGRKTANVVLGNAFGINEGIVVDTHVGRLARRLGLTRESTPEKVERDLMRLFEPKVWTLLSHWLIWHGRRCCRARNPDCAGCQLRAWCPSAGQPLKK
jgi:endonuclease-3